MIDKKQYAKEYYVKHRDEQIACSINYRKNNLEKVNQYQKEYMVKNTHKYRDKNIECRKNWELNNKEWRFNYTREYRKKKPEVDIKSRCKVKYGISFGRYIEMLYLQNGRCAICKNELNGKLGIDHNHCTKKVRGLLCIKCNSALGFLKENPIVIQCMIDYLKKYDN
jgi:hypothetical protein